jgi:hypothetical protein
MTRIPIFLSAPKSFLHRQEKFIVAVEESLREHDLHPQTLGRSDYDLSAPLEAIRRLMNGSCGLICIGLGKSKVEVGTDRPESDRGESARSLDSTWQTSAYCQIEPAMAYQIGIPILVWREAGVVADGIFDRGAAGLSMPHFDLDTPPDLTVDQWRQPLRAWIDQVRKVYHNRGSPPRQW